MANTEGMPDSFVGELALAGADGTPCRREEERTQRDRYRRQQRQKKLARTRMRMETPVGERPAATVVRASRGNHRGEADAGAKLGADAGSAAADAGAEPGAEPGAKPPPLVGSIVEHELVKGKGRRLGHKAPARASRFASRNSSNNTNSSNNNTNNNKNNKTTRQAHAGGFPSVRGVPIGTFVSRAPKASASGSPRRRRAEGRPPEPLPAGPEGHHRRLEEASRRDADALLAGMSPGEIADRRKEIEEALSPDLLAFLKHRRNPKRDPKRDPKPKPAEAPERSKPAAPPAASEREAPGGGLEFESFDEPFPWRNEEGHRGEKERIAGLVASIRTYDDLDSAYRAEMGSGEPVFGDSNNSNSNSSTSTSSGERGTHESRRERFLVACDLLRSSSPRQTLWAARTVGLELQKLVASGSSARQQQQQHQIRNGRARDEGKPTQERKPESSAWTHERDDLGIAPGDLPVVLPVSLRCLLDKPPNSSRNHLLHTYALRALCSATLLFAHPGHDAMVSLGSASCSLDREGASSAFRKDYMDDAFPSPPSDTAYPPMVVLPLEAGSGGGSQGGQAPSAAAAYTTSSSEVSATADGEAFRRDPLWTLLSRMKILPRLGVLLEHAEWAILEGALGAICGILAMVGQRSPGAASAIVQHGSLTPLLSKRMLEKLRTTGGRWNDDERGDASESEKQPTSCTGTCSERENETENDSVLATVRLFAILSRQSRVAAGGIPLEDVLPPLLAGGIASSLSRFVVQREALFLWRTMLRYGLGLEALASALTEAARHLALPCSHEFSLSSDFLSCFTLVIECAWAARSKTEAKAPRATTGGSDPSEQGAPVLGRAAIEIAETATTMMASTLPMVLPNDPPAPPEGDGPKNTEDWIVACRWNASRLLYAAAWFRLFDPPPDRPPAAGEPSIGDFVSPCQQESLLLALSAWAEPGGMARRAWDSVAKWCDPDPGFERAPLGEGAALRAEAASSRFLDAYFSIALVLLRSSSRIPNHRSNDDAKRSLHERLIRMVLDGLAKANDGLSEARPSRTSCAASPASESPVREAWTSQCHFSVAKFCLHSLSEGLFGSSSDLALLRSLVFSLLGRLQRGNESVAAVLLSSDVLFQTCGDPSRDEDASSAKSSLSSPISSMFLGEICGSEASRKQLDHSFKLQHGFGITSDGFGPFALDSLRSCADGPTTAPSARKDGSDVPALPLGKMWLWQSLSGSIRMREDVLVAGTKEASDVIASVLELILELDETEDVTGIAGYAGRLPMGSKLYYLMNVCLQHEHVLRDERILNTGEALLDRYLMDFGRNDNDVLDFCRECLEHSGHTEKAERSNEDDETENALEEKDKKVLDDFANAITNIQVEDADISSEQIRALVALLEDLTTAYRDYGAQYDFFTKCIRVFLLPMFPSLIRCRALKELHNMLHILTLPKEAEDEIEMMELLSRSLTGGLPAADDSLKDGTDILNAFAKAVASASTRPLNGYMRHFCIGMLVRNLAISLSTGQGIEISQKRLERLGTKTVVEVCRATEVFLETGSGTKRSLVKAILETSPCDSGCGEQPMDNKNQSATGYLDCFIAKHS